jgi:hypothetical protein
MVALVLLGPVWIGTKLFVPDAINMADPHLIPDA